MHKVIQPLSEEFLYCSPEIPEKNLYRVLTLLQRPKPRLQKVLLKEWKRHEPKK